ncbi:hypothetical protein C483_12023 [Natrialba hulunbeirensis JCM 10989]|uniref:Lipoprotein n=1 Tax=Natrialba hulunbeirensis JCM 10989 TaxID=1227493 RepID=L9ZUR7_9EURY|nr:hypothetical protein [Natrialba hulunbeirensis]ELY90235.1 hypothetical protein C483_12023 [Natrialba hulunbeirensis JCM 10989]
MQRSRRNLLSASGLTLAALAGCVDSPAVGTEPAGETEIIETRTESGDRSGSSEDPPVVEYDADSREIQVSGVFPIGNSCYSSRIADPEYDADADELTVRIGREHDGSDTCEDVFNATSYRIIVEFEGAAPGTVVAVENGAYGEEETRKEL